MEKSQIDKIAALKAKVQLLEIFVPLGRNKPEELIEAKRVLEVAMALPPQPPNGELDPRVAAKPSPDPNGVHTPSVTVSTMMDRLMAEHKVLRQAQGAKANLLAFIPKHQNAKELTTELIDMAKKIEAIWDQYRNLQRYGELNNPYEVEIKPELSAPEKARLYDLKIDLSKWQNIRQKAIAKIKNPQAFIQKDFDKKIQEWKQQLLEATNAEKSIKLELSSLER